MPSDAYTSLVDALIAACLSRQEMEIQRLRVLILEAYQSRSIPDDEDAQWIRWTPTRGE